MDTISANHYVLIGATTMIIVPFTMMIVVATMIIVNCTKSIVVATIWA